MKIKEVIATLEKFAPLPLQDGYDNAGLQVGLTEAEVSGVLLCLDVTEKVLDEAVEKGCNLVVSHHPLLFRAVKCVSDATLVQRCVRKAVKHDLTLYAAHTNLDNARGGVNYEIAERLGLQRISFLDAHGEESGSGIVGKFVEPLSAEDFLKKVKRTFNVECVMHNALLEKGVKRVAVCGGAGDFLLDKALEVNADAFITGEMHYHQFFGWEGQLQIAVIGHYQSEQFTIDLLGRILKQAHPELELKKTEINTNPIYYL